MITSSSIKMETVWNSVQEPRSFAQLPASYMLLLSALDQGWKITHVESVPSWDQHGFVFLVSLQTGLNMNTSELILPHNRWIEDLLRDYFSRLPFGKEGSH